MNRKEPEKVVFRHGIYRVFNNPWMVLWFIFLMHASVRFGGLYSSYLIPISMVLLWPLPWLLCPRSIRIEMGFRWTGSWWYVAGPFFSVVVLLLTAGITWLVFGKTDSNWFVQHALTLREAITNLPQSTSLQSQFLIVTIPALIFSPLGEEFLFRGILQRGLSIKFRESSASIIQAAAFALVHLAHYGLQPFQPELILIWLPSMFLAGLTFGWIVIKSKSIWCGVLSHAVYNLGMNVVVFLMLPGEIGL
jgi:membrane protease YdiL (CAAX protease family)